MLNNSVRYDAALLIATNASKNFTTPTQNPSQTTYIDGDVFPTGIHWFINMVMLLITLSGIIGNGLVCYFFASKKVKFTSFNLLLLNLSATDLMACVSAYLTIFIDLKMLRRFSKETANILCAFTIGITSYSIMLAVSVLTLTYISLNRFVVIRYPMNTAWFKSRRNTLCYIAIIWIASIGAVSPNIISFQFSSTYATCPRDWPKNFQVRLWSLSLMVLGLLVPILVMLLAFFAAKHQFKKTERAASSNTDAMKRKKRTVKLLGLLILAYFLCMAPASIYLFFSISVKSVWPEGHEGEVLRMKFIRVTFLICLINTVADPVIYGYNNSEFQTCFRAIFKKLKCKFRVMKQTEETNTQSSRVVSSRTNEACTGQSEDTKL